MSEERRKNLRTQGRYDGKVQKGREKKNKSSLGSSKDSPEARLPNRNSECGNNSLADDSLSPVKYEEKSEYTFSQLKEVAKPVELNSEISQEHILSKTENGESRIAFEPDFLSEDERDMYFEALYETIQFDARNILIHGVEYPQPRLVAWFGPYPYTYSGNTLEPAEMPDVVLEIKSKVEKLLASKGMNAEFNSVLINLYRNGKDSVAWHSDDEIMLGFSPTIASVSLGETRKFEMRPKPRNYEETSPSDSTAKYVLHLTHGSLVVMSGCMQKDWQHRVPKEYHDKEPRINLTFRTVYSKEEAPEHVPGSQPKMCNRRSSPTRKYGCKLDDEHFPMLQKDSAKSYVTHNKHDNVDEESWDSEINDNLHNENVTVCKNNEENGLINEKLAEKWNNIEPKCDYEKNPMDDKTSKKLWCDEYDSSVNSYQEKNTVLEKPEIKCNKSVNNSLPNETERNKSHRNIDSRKLHNQESRFQQSSFNREESSIKSLNSKANSYIDVNQENNMNPKNPPNRFQDNKSNVWTDSAEDNNLVMEKAAKMPLNMDVKGFTNCCTNVILENDLNYKMLPHPFVETHLWVKSSEGNNLAVKQPAKTVLNVEAKEFIPHNIQSNEVSQFSGFKLEDLINCDINLLQGKNLQDHAQCLKSQASERMADINRFHRKELHFLLEITDGSQTDKNQRLISIEICRIVQNSLMNNQLPPNAMPPIDRGFRRGYGNQNYYSDKGKRYPNQTRNPKYNQNKY